MSDMPAGWADQRVAAAAVDTGNYPPTHSPDNVVSRALRDIAELLSWGTPALGPFGAVIPAGSRVVVKPNWVLHRNHGPWGIEPLLTHASLIRAVVDDLLLAEPATVLVGDAPIQGCDFEQLMAVTGMGEWGERKRAEDPRFAGIRDFRRTKTIFRNGVRQALEDQLSLDQFVLFDLGADSLLEPVTDGRDSFRVTQYDPAQMARTHGPQRHQYLVARETIAADVIVNLPKLKTHKKAGLTCALKNLIGINGNKEYLPHHRLGGSRNGGDCYPGQSAVKEALEAVYDRLNSTTSQTRSRLWLLAARLLQRVSRMQGDRLGIEGSWSGNDTIWRTCLDLNRILLYGRVDGSMAETPQRKVLNVVDAIVAGQGDGPLSPQPLRLGLLLGGSSSAAVDWVGAQLLGYEPERIPVAREAFGGFRWPLASFAGTDVEVVGDPGSGAVNQVGDVRPSCRITYPLGWIDAVAAGRGGLGTTGPADAPGDA